MNDATREAALLELVRATEEAGTYDTTVDDLRCHCGRVCCRHHEDD